MLNIFKRIVMTAVTAIILLLFAACTKTSVPELIEDSDGMVTWGDFQLIREDIADWGKRWWDYADISLQWNVLGAKDQTLWLSIESRMGENGQEYGQKEFVQVKLNGYWYTISKELPKPEVPLILEGRTREKREVIVEHTIDLSPLGRLPAGEYRLIEKFSSEEREESGYSFARFWVIKPGAKIPPESMTSGEARMEDIIFTIEPAYAMWNNITDMDDVICLTVENLSGKIYHMRDPDYPVLEHLQNGQWEEISYFGANSGWLDGWRISSDELFFNEPLTAGHYRVSIPMHADGTKFIAPQCEFDVFSMAELPEPQWDKTELQPSRYDEAEQSADVRISFKDSVLTKNNRTLEGELGVKQSYTYGTYELFEVWIDGDWYEVPFEAGTGWTQPAFTINAGIALPITFDPIQSIGTLPLGRYRVVKEFSLDESENKSPTNSNRIKEFAAAEFIVAELIPYTAHIR